MSGHVGLREDAQVGHQLARRIAMLFVGWVEPQAKPNDPRDVGLRFASLNPTYGCVRRLCRSSRRLSRQHRGALADVGVPDGQGWELLAPVELRLAEVEVTEGASDADGGHVETTR